MKVLITGGAGYIGATIVTACEDAGIAPIILDNFTSGSRAFVRGRTCYEGDIADGAMIDRIFAEHPGIHATIHCAALTVVADSVRDPMRYYQENVGKSLEFFGHLLRNGARRLVFSSSAAVYASLDGGRMDESFPLAAASPYARTKYLTEAALQDVAGAQAIRVIAFRYFNPIGADPRLRTGSPVRYPTHVIGQLLKAFRTGEPFTVMGTSWPTRDGSSVRDYIHVWDLALGHISALRRFDEVIPPGGSGGYEVINLGTGRGTTVRELHAAFAATTGQPLGLVETLARPGDVIGGFTSIDKALRLLGWKPELSVTDGISSALAWNARMT